MSIRVALSEIVLIIGPGLVPADYDLDPARVRLIPFTSQEHLLHGVAAVVTHGGTGTVLGALSCGIPLVVVPQAADQFMQARQGRARGRHPPGPRLTPGKTAFHDRDRYSGPDHGKPVVIMEVGSPRDQAPAFSAAESRCYGSKGGATPQPQCGTGACGGTSAPGWELCMAIRVPHSR